MSDKNLQELRKKRIADMTLEELEIAILRLHNGMRVTMDLKEFCETLNRSETTVRNHLRCRHYPESLLVGGYSRNRGDNYRFLREEVLQWIKNKEKK